SGRRINTRIVWPFELRWAIRCCPMKPVPPVTKHSTLTSLLLRHDEKARVNYRPNSTVKYFFMRIGELENRSGTSRHTLRYYEKIGLVSPSRRTNSYRVYTAQTLRDLEFIQRAQSMGFSLGEIGEILDAQRKKLIDCADGATIISRKMAEVKDKIANLKSIYR